LDPIPLLLESSDWERIEAGIQQRAKLLNLLFKDIYGEQRVLKQNIVPSEVIFGHSGFLREVHGLYAHLEHPLMIVAADLARGPDGKMWVIHDRVQSPSGLGYAVENRLTMNSAVQTLYSNISIRRLYTFYEDFKSMLMKQGAHNKSEPLNVLLTPGAHNETYFEHAYLSSFLGLTLVQGQDLLVKGGAVWLKSLKGLRRVDAILRRLDESYCDPLELRADSKLGVSGLVHAVRKQGITMANPLGCGILENLGLHPFMPELAHFFLNEELILPQIASWWCGQEKECEYVLENLSTLIIKTIDRSGDQSGTYRGKNLSADEQTLLRAKILENPHLFVGQEEVQFATAPSLVEGEIKPRHVVIRSFAITKDAQYEVMPGALVRVGSSDDSLIVSGQRSGSSKDLWILGESGPVTPNNAYKPKATFENSLENIPSLRAENLFWLGRYLMRCIMSARMIRITLKSLANATRYDRQGNLQAQEILCDTLCHLSMTYPGFLGEGDEKVTNPVAEIWSVIAQSDRVGSLYQALNMLSSANTSTKNLLPLESWRIFDRLMREWSEYANDTMPQQRMMISGLDTLLVQLMAYKSLIEDSLFAQQGLILYEIGAGLERAQLLIAKSRSMLTAVHEPFTEYEILETLLSSSESLNAYRAHYRASIELEHVSEFMLLDSHFPKSLISEISHLLKLLPKLPKFKHDIYLSRYEEPLFEAFSILRLSRIESLCALALDSVVRENLDALLASVSEKLIVASDELSKTYFAHYDE
ncbi:MAG: circularly permuted type 2 ATP-grasp protein, partial [Sulfuricurvum sp.]|nr:circularly permuted type 2 ATP-grasp protein [Sulfuricurvum sp.]